MDHSSTFCSSHFSATQQLRGRALPTRPYLDHAFSLPFNLPHPRHTFIPCARRIHPPSHLAFGKHGCWPRASLTFLVANDRDGKARCGRSNLGVRGGNALDSWTASFGIHWKQGPWLVLPGGPLWIRNTHRANLHGATRRRRRRSATQGTKGNPRPLHARRLDVGRPGRT